MNGFLHITKIILDITCIESVYQHLRNAGSKGVEGVALFAGSSEGPLFEIKTVIVPKQTGYNIENGLFYSVDGDELHRINIWLYQNKMTLISQIHSHPGEAYHSDTDDRFPIVAEVGGFSIVVPNFAFDPFTLDSLAVYRLLPGRGWCLLSKKEVDNLIQIVA